MSHARSNLTFMSFIRFLLGETKPPRILLAFIGLGISIFLLPQEYEKKMPSGFQSLYFLLILTILGITGFVFASIENKKPKLSGASPVFDQASSVVIALAILLIPICLIRPEIISLFLLLFVVELGLVFGKYIYLSWIDGS